MLTGLPLLLLILAAIVFIVLASSFWKVHPFIALLLASLGLGLAAGLPAADVIQAINSGFGGLMGYIGLIVVLGSIIGLILERSGAALRIAELLLKAVGPKQPALAMSAIGATVGVPVFCDSGFVILSGLNNALAKRTTTKKATLALALASGLYTTHTLVPPTPGPIAAAGNLGAGNYLGMVMLLGLAVSIPAAAAAYFFACAKGKNIEAAESGQEPEENAGLPAALPSLAPIMLPILLIASSSIIDFLKVESAWARWLHFAGHPLIALLAGLLLAFVIFRSRGRAKLTEWVGEGIRLSGPILVITGAGGAFGGVLKATPVAGMATAWVQNGQFSGAFFLIIAFLVAALLKSSQGSSTNALVITSSMLAPLVAAMGFDTPYELALAVLAIGGGAMTVSHANDSYFWVVSQFGGIGIRDAYRTFTIMTGLQGLVVLAMVLLLFWLQGLL